MEQAADASSDLRMPRTARGKATRRKLIAAAAAEFGDSGFHAGSISGITRRAGVAMGTFYTYFESKDAIFRALVQDMSGAVREAAGAAIAEVTDPLVREREALAAFLAFASMHKEVYRIIDEAEFVDPASWRGHYETTARRISERLQAGAAAGAFRSDLDETAAWAVMGMNVFLGLRYAIWAEEGDPDAATVAAVGNTLLASGIAVRPEPKR